jgi:hypothetical protein
VSLNGYYIDLNIGLPITPDELFDDDDIAFIECLDPYKTYREPFTTTNIYWNIGKVPTPDGIVGYLTSYELADKCKSFFNNTFKINPLTEDLQPGYPYYPLTLVKFNQNSAYHREGFAEWYTDEHKEVFKGRFQMAINFKMYGNAEGTSVQFGKPSEHLLQEEKYLSQKIIARNRKRIENNAPELGSTVSKRISVSNEDNSLSVYLGRTGFRDTKYENTHIETVATREGYYSPYIINVQQWHKVITTSGPRVSLRFMCGDKYSFEQLEKTHESGKLINE